MYSLSSTAMRTLSCLLLLLASATMAQEAAVECPFDCANGSTCTACENEAMIGDIETCREGRRCECPEGWTGLRCHREYESCYAQESDTKDEAHKCHHGGKCIEGFPDKYGNDQYFCDCSAAKAANGRPFTGKYCEHEAINLCDNKAHEFCVNGQDCLSNKDPAKNDTHFCECSGHLTGPHCEFHKNSVPDCDLECRNDGACQLGIKNYALAVLGYNDFWKQHEEAMHCTCPEGFFGVRCEISAQKCGNHHCFNGANCLTSEDGTTKTCDCNSASTKDDSFAGKYCQYRATTFCEKSAAIEGQDFCVNGGTCKDGKPGCDCPAGFDGPLCEYNQTLDGAKDESAGCSLSCQNDGVCRKGIKDLTLMGGSLALDDAPSHIDYQHCICPDGWFGALCDRKVELCGDGNHVCLNGAKCHTGDNKDEWSCKCEDRFAGVYCQHEASSYCTQDSQSVINDASMEFCVNGGTCSSSANGSGKPGCECSEEFAGPHCEFPISTIENILRKGNAEKEGSWEGLDIFLAVFFTAIAVISLAIVYSVRQKRKDAASMDKDMAMRDAAMSTPHPTHSTVHSMVQDLGDDPIVLDFGPERDQEGTELSNVEII